MTETRKYMDENTIKLESGGSYTDPRTRAIIENNTAETMYIDPTGLNNGEVRVLNGAGFGPEKHKGIGRIAEKEPPKAVRVQVGEYLLIPLKFKLLAKYDDGIECFSLEYATFSGEPTFAPRDTFYMRVLYSDGSDAAFGACSAVETSRDLRGTTGTTTLILKCHLKLNKECPEAPKLPWEKIKDPKNPSLFVIQDWKMDMTTCKIDIKTDVNRGPENSIALIKFEIEKVDNDEFGRIKGNPILYFEYPEGKFTFGVIKVFVFKTKTIKGQKFVPYEFMAKLTKEVATK